MLPEELIRKVRLIEITTRKRVDDSMSGSYRSHFKGHGVQFSEHRQYVPGDDIRHIDWKVSARTREPLIKKFEEERELTVFVVVDSSGSGKFGSTSKLKSEVAAEIAGLLTYAASHTGDKVGALLFSGGIDRIIRPKKGKQHTLRIIREILAHKNLTAGTDLKGALESTYRIMKHAGVVFVISDFMASNYAISLKRLARKHDVVAFQIMDEREKSVPPVGHLLLVDPESGQESFVDTASYAFQKWVKDYNTQVETESQAAFKGGRIEHLVLSPQDDYAEKVVRFFQKRSRKTRK